MERFEKTAERARNEDVDEETDGEMDEESDVEVNEEIDGEAGGEGDPMEICEQAFSALHVR
jgi:hypothetical protein